MRSLRNSVILLALMASPAAAQEAEKKVSLLDASYGLMFWTLVIFAVLFFLLSRYAFGPITAAVVAREKALEDAIAAAKADRDEAMRVLAQNRAALDAAHAEGQKFIVDARVAAERVRSDLIEQAHTEQVSMLARARQEIENEKTKAIAALRKEAVELAIAGASKVIEKNLDQQSNRELVEKFLSSVSSTAVTASR